MRVYFDESGNTGVNLSDPAQPAFSLASVVIDGDVAHALVAPLIRTGQREVKYTSLSSSASGQKALLRLLQSPHINSSAIKVAVTDKRYYLVAHLVDKIIEPVFTSEALIFTPRDATSDIQMSCIRRGGTCSQMVGGRKSSIHF